MLKLDKKYNYYRTNTKNQAQSLGTNSHGRIISKYRLII